MPVVQERTILAAGHDQGEGNARVTPYLRVHPDDER
jgi:hypothetical protein